MNNNTGNHWEQICQIFKKTFPLVCHILTQAHRKWVEGHSNVKSDQIIASSLHACVFCIEDPGTEDNAECILSKTFK